MGFTGYRQAGTGLPDEVLDTFADRPDASGARRNHHFGNLAYLEPQFGAGNIDIWAICAPSVVSGPMDVSQSKNARNVAHLPM